MEEIVSRFITLLATDPRFAALVLLAVVSGSAWACCWAIKSGY